MRKPGSGQKQFGQHSVLTEYLDMPCRAKPEDIAVRKTNKDLPVPAELTVTWGGDGH